MDTLKVVLKTSHQSTSSKSYSKMRSLSLVSCKLQEHVFKHRPQSTFLFFKYNFMAMEGL